MRETHLAAGLLTALIETKAGEERIERTSGLAGLAHGTPSTELITNAVTPLARLRTALSGEQTHHDVHEPLLHVWPALRPLQGVEDGSIRLHGQSGAQILGDLHLLPEFAVTIQIALTGVLAGEYFLVISSWIQRIKKVSIVIIMPKLDHSPKMYADAGSLSTLSLKLCSRSTCRWMSLCIRTCSTSA